MISTIADIFGILSGLIAILSFIENKKIPKQTNASVDVSFKLHADKATYTSSALSPLDGEFVLALWGLGFLLCLYIYNNYRYWLMPAAATVILIITIFVYFFFKSSMRARPLPNKYFGVYIFSVFFTAATIMCTAVVQHSTFGSDNIFHASQILSVILSTLTLAILAWRMIAFSKGRSVNLNHLIAAAAVSFISFLLASGSLYKFSDFFRVDF
ncbi:MAG: hypothetical protein J6D57_11835 [Mogibacterium sp.]|nr:hypothetical protein [Mogibacterium sp.]